MLTRAAMTRTLVIGNTGSGKSWLAAHLAELLRSPAVDLDEIYWAGDSYGLARPKDQAMAMARAAAAEPRWIIEGVYGSLAREAMERATALIWLDLPVATCLERLNHRGLRRGADDAAFAAMLSWAADYPHRYSASSLTGHAALFDDFGGRKVQITSGAAVDAFLKDLAGL